MRGFLIGLSVSLAFVLGSAASSTRFGVQRAQAESASEGRWSYFCFAATDANDVSTKANAAGMRGWEMVAANSAAEGQGVWCFRKPRP